MPIVTVKNRYQVAIPQTVRKQLGIHRGDLLEAKVVNGKLIYIQKTRVDRIPTSKTERDRYFKNLRSNAPHWLQEIWRASKRAGLDKLTMAEINAEIAAYRSEKGRRKSTSKQPVK